MLSLLGNLLNFTIVSKMMMMMMMIIIVNAYTETLVTFVARFSKITYWFSKLPATLLLQ